MAGVPGANRSVGRGTARARADGGWPGGREAGRRARAVGATGQVLSGAVGPWFRRWTWVALMCQLCAFRTEQRVGDRNTVGAPSPIPR